MITDNITFDKLLSDMDQQIEILNAIAADNPILNEQLRLLHESREMLLFLEMELHRLEELIDPDDFRDHASMLDVRADEA